MDLDQGMMKQFIMDVIDEMITPNPVEMAPKWVGGKAMLHPSGDQQPKEVPLEVFFKKIVGVRDSLRVMEQKINSHATLSMEEKMTLQSYITKAYGSLTTFNILFKNEKDKFVGAGGKSGGSEGNAKDNMTINEAKAKLGIKEYQTD